MIIDNPTKYNELKKDFKQSGKRTIQLKLISKKGN